MICLSLGTFYECEKRWEDGKWERKLICNKRPVQSSFCFRLVARGVVYLPGVVCRDPHPCAPGQAGGDERPRASPIKSPIQAEPWAAHRRTVSGLETWHRLTTLLHGFTPQLLTVTSAESTDLQNPAASKEGGWCSGLWLNCTCAAKAVMGRVI